MIFGENVSFSIFLIDDRRWQSRVQFQDAAELVISEDPISRSGIRHLQWKTYFGAPWMSDR